MVGPQDEVGAGAGHSLADVSPPVPSTPVPPPPQQVLILGRKWWQDLILGLGIAILGGLIVGWMLSCTAKQIESDRLREAQLAKADKQQRDIQGIDEEMSARTATLVSALDGLGYAPFDSSPVKNKGKFQEVMNALWTFYQPPRPRSRGLDGLDTGELVVRLDSLQADREDLRQCALTAEALPRLWTEEVDIVFLHYDATRNDYMLDCNSGVIDPFRLPRVPLSEFLSVLLLPRWRGGASGDSPIPATGAP